MVVNPHRLPIVEEVLRFEAAFSVCGLDEAAVEIVIDRDWVFTPTF